MPKIGLILLLLLGARGEKPEHVVIVSIDGLRPDFYLGEYEAPALKAIAAEGVRAELVESVYPSSTYPAHATIVTGVRPAKHGISANTLWTEQGSTRDWYWYAKEIKSRTLWQAAREKGLKTAITYWPTSVGAEADWVLGEIWDPEQKETVKRLASSATPGLMTELVLGVGIPQTKITEDKVAIDGFVSRAAAYVFKRYKPNLQLVHLLNVDEVQHKQGPRSTAVGAAVKTQDENIARIRKAIEESGLAEKTVLIVVGDHGFMEIARNFSPNRLLKEAGLVDETDGKIASWKALVRSSGGSASVYVKDPADILRVAEVLQAGSMLNGKAIYEVIGRARLDGLGYNPDAALALEPGDGWAITERFTDTIPTVKGNHGQLPTRIGLSTGFLAVGPGIKAGGVIAKMRLIDVAPTVAAFLGLQMDGMDGAALDFSGSR